MTKSFFDPAEFAKRVTSKMARDAVTIRTLAEQLGISRTALHRAMQGHAPSVENYLRLQGWLETQT